MKIRELHPSKERKQMNRNKEIKNPANEILEVQELVFSAYAFVPISYPVI